MDSKICEAAYENNVELVKRLLVGGASVESLDRDKRTPLLNCVSSKGADIHLAKLLIKEGANYDFQDSNGFSALHFCAQYRHTNIARLLLENGARSDLRDKWGNLALLRALGPEEECGELIELLIEYNSDPHSKNKSGVSVMDHVLKLKIHPNHEYFVGISSE